ncbi:serine threonine kinase [Fusarium albosuccineum]|uniref:Serine threonine kinase n=1 Tax=Fusarium albosuccineum TaxID=1237068 RepID=A0A8H4P297_9HYPO|nr:serine threonine kinase [Fusarium albosuccineum]
MRASLSHTATGLALFALANAQSLSEELSSAIADYSTLSLFRSLLEAAPEALKQSFSEKSTDITVLIPTDDAINTYLSASGASDISDLNEDDMETFFSYHIMVSSLKASDFEEPQGMTIPTLLKKVEFNNRSAGADLTTQFGKDAGGQVLFASPPSASGKKVKRAGEFSGPNVNLRAGLAQDVKMTAVDGSWGPKKANTYQIVDSVLLPPRKCSTTVRSIKDTRLSALDTALNKTQLWPALDHSPNVTCLAPSTQGFKNAGDPQINMDTGDLRQALLAHTLTQVTYTDHLTDGMVLGTLNDTTVRVSIKKNEIYFNNAKVVKANVLTNNGLIHMQVNSPTPLRTTANSKAPSDTSTETSASETSGTSSPQATDAASTLSMAYPGVFALIAGLFMI